MKHLADQLRAVAARLRREAAALEGMADGAEHAPRASAFTWLDGASAGDLRARIDRDATSGDN